MSDTFGVQAMKSSGPSISLIDNSKSVGVGNYKGVMLCNRPFGGVTAAPNQTAVADKSSFACGVVPQELGQTVLMSSKEKFKLQRSKKDSVLSKHKKWLHDLQKTKDQLEAQYIEEMQRKEEAQAKFTDHEAKLRQMTRGILQSGDEKGGSNQQTDFIDSAAKEIQLKMAAAESKRAGGKGKSRPAWAKAESADKAESDDEFEDAEGLLEFAQGLDYDRYIDDIEVKSMMERLRRRIKDLEKEVAQDEAREMDAEVRSKKKQALALMGEAAATIESGFEGKDADDKVSDAARELLQGDEEMQAVHSAKSVTAMLRAARDKIAAGKQDGKVVASKNANEPLVVVHDQNDGTRLEGKNTVSNLPYIHRNPAV